LFQVNQFDVSKGKSFGNYAALRIRGALLDELRRIRLPSSCKQGQSQVSSGNNPNPREQIKKNSHGSRNKKRTFTFG
jgi:DNA-directed RNA polymerase specialized sigma subunit